MVEYEHEYADLKHCVIALVKFIFNDRLDNAILDVEISGHDLHDILVDDKV